MAELVLSPIIDSTISRVISTAMEQINLAVRWKLELKKLCSKLTMIRAVLQDAEDRGVVSSPPVKIWLGKLRDVAREAEDVLDEVTYERLKREVEFENQMKKKVCFFFTLSNPLVFRLQMNNKIQNLITSIVEINDEATKFGLQCRLAGPVLESRSKPTTTYSCLGYCSEVIGRKGDVSKIVDLLIDSSNKQPLSVISIWGMGGLGKTTLVKSVLKDEKISKHFGQIMFVCVSEDFDVRRILKEIFESLNQMSCSIENVSTLVETIRRKLKNENYLLILDDVWNEDRLKWEALRGCLLEINKNKESRIVVTTRSEKVALTMGTVDEHMYHLKGLNHQECWSIMRQRAFGDSSVPNPELEGIGRQIAKKCGGVPLVANVMGATLGNRKDRHEWLLIKNLDAWDSLKDDSGEGIQRILQLSYDRLPGSTLKQCFAFCSILPKGYPIQKEVLIQLWMAEGYLQPPEGSSVVIEDIGDRYFNDLLSYSLFEGKERDLYGNIYRMHDLIHDLAMYNSKSEALIFKASSERNIAHVQHLNLVDSRERMPTNFGEVAEKLRSLFCEADTFNKMSQSFKRLRILKLWDADKLHQLPVSIGKMKHLRFLDISGANIKEVPQFIMKLYSLQTFRFMNCHLIEKQPKGVENLVNLKHIYFNNEKCMPVGIGRLTDLQTLGLFVVGRQEGSQITELGSLSRLKGELWISHLEHVENYPESSKAKLCEKIGVYKLKLEWKWGRNIVESKIDETVLEGLRPHSSLRSLIVKGYGGEKCPSWMNCSLSEFFFLNNLVELNIEFCDKLKCIPNMSGFSALQQFNIIRCKELTSIGDEAFVLPTSLRQLLVSYCPRLEAIGDSLCALTCLEDLELIGCENLRPIPSVNGLSSLRKLSIVDCDGLVCLPCGLSSCTALKVLWISNCCNLITISEDLKELRSLVVLRIFDCENLRSIPKESLPSNIGLDWVEKANSYNASSSTAQYPMNSDN